MTTITTIRSKTSTTAPVVGDMISTVAKRTTAATTATDCPNCGYDVFLADDHAHHQRISELEAQIRFLNKTPQEQQQQQHNQQPQSPQLPRPCPLPKQQTITYTPLLRQPLNRA
ncbi:hypothetical protein I7I51_04646 [Histoplasma capsulatum]|uniref:Uncharacterized protein n=1 Tax=Ajellomyces capsulatus TaxID=5037 RepID=A0A8A1M3D1_AJECA|nr:hypothetical protein I7I51_04646 [Histoplasma capsulatum]